MAHHTAAAFLKQFQTPSQRQRLRALVTQVRSIAAQRGRKVAREHFRTEVRDIISSTNPSNKVTCRTTRIHGSQGSEKEEKDDRHLQEEEEPEGAVQDPEEETEDAESTSTKGPSCYTCPLSQQIMQDPVLLLDSGHTYERGPIEVWLRAVGTDPCTGRHANVGTLIHNHALRAAIKDYEQHPDHQALLARWQPTVTHPTTTTAAWPHMTPAFVLPTRQSTMPRDSEASRTSPTFLSGMVDRRRARQTGIDHSDIAGEDENDCIEPRKKKQRFRPVAPP